MSKKYVSRRVVLQGIGIGTLGLTLSSLPHPGAQSAAAQEMAQATAFYRFNLGDLEITVIRDGRGSFDASIFGSNAGEGEIDEILSAANFPTGEQTGIFDVILIRNGDDLTLLDTGLGDLAPTAGLLNPTLELIGVSPNDISTVVLSHFHPDHISGVQSGGTILYPNARYLMPQAEWDALSGDPSGIEAFDNAVAAANTRLQPIVDADQLEFYNDEDEVVSGVQARTTPGHTPGHHSFMISSGGSSLMNIVDAALHPVISLARPDFFPNFDAIPELAVETRQTLLASLADEGQLMFGYHFPFPGIGYVARMGDNSYRFVPVVT